MTSIDIKRITRSMALLTAVTLTSACVSTPTHSSLRSIPPGEKIHVIATESEVETPDARTGGQNVASGAAGGAAGGAVMGAGAGFMMGFACGPLFVVCSPAGLVGGAAGGAIFGAAVGGISNAMLALPKEKAEALESVMAATIEDFRGSQTLARQFQLQSNDRWSFTDSGATKEITLGIEELSIDQGKNDELIVTVVNSMTVSYGPVELDTSDTVLFTFVSDRHHVDYWLEHDGANFRAVIQEGFTTNIADMISELEGQSIEYQF